MVVACSCIVQSVISSEVDSLKVDASLFDEELDHQVVALLYGQEERIATVGVKPCIDVHALLDAFLRPLEVADAHGSAYGMVELLDKLWKTVHDGVAMCACS